MHKDEMEGAGKDAKGQIKEGVGKLTGDQDMQAEGHADQAEGKVQKGVGNLKEGVRDILKN